MNYKTVERTNVTEGYRDWTLNRSATLTHSKWFSYDGAEVSVFTISAFGAPIMGNGKVESYNYKTRKAAERKFAELTEFYNNPTITTEYEDDEAAR